MAAKFEDQGGVATSDPSPIYRWLASKIMTRMSSEKSSASKRAKTEKARVKSGQRHVVEYFHQVDDGYSHLAAQVLPALCDRYDIELVCHLVSGPLGANSAEPELLLNLSRYDAYHIAPHYHLDFPEHPEAVDQAMKDLATSIFASLDPEGFTAHGATIGQALWSGDEAALKSLADQFGAATREECETKIAAGDARRDELGHYSGAMFYYGGEWYWGVDRLYHLETRLGELGADKQPGQGLLMPRPALEAGELKDTGNLTFEIYPSLRSPYTSISFDRAVKLARDTGVNLIVRPVLPMVMRGVPATRQKGMYIFTDTAREARAAGIPYGNFYDPIGDPVRRCYSLYPWACEQGRGIELLSSFLSAAFAHGVNTNNDSGLKAVVETAGLDWEQARQIVGKPGWEELLESNRQAMYDAGLWGVPSFRLLDEDGKQLLALWGQDRLWLFAREIQKQLASRT